MNGDLDSDDSGELDQNDSDTMDSDKALNLVRSDLYSIKLRLVSLLTSLLLFSLFFVFRLSEWVRTEGDGR